VLIQINVIYDLAFLPVLVIGKLPQGGLSQLLYLAIYIGFEIFRMMYRKSHIRGYIPAYMPFVVVTLAPMLPLDILLGFILKRSAIDFACMVGYIIIHVIELCYVVPVYMAFKKYQNGFYQFARRMEQTQEDAARPLMSDSDG